MESEEAGSLYGAVTSVEDLGSRIRTKRKQLGFTLEQVSGLSGASIRFLSELERGKQTIEIGKALNIVNCLGLELVVLPKGRYTDVVLNA